MPLLLKKYFSRIVRLHLCNISLKIVDRHIWQWMWTVVIFQVTMKLRTTGKQIRSCFLFSIYACINMEKKIKKTYADRHTHTHTYTHWYSHVSLVRKYSCVATLIHITTPTHYKNSICIGKCKIANISKHERRQMNGIHTVKPANK